MYIHHVQLLCSIQHVQHNQLELACRAEFMKQVLPRLLRPQSPARELSRMLTLIFESHMPSRRLPLEYELLEAISFLLDEFSPNTLQCINIMLITVECCYSSVTSNVNGLLHTIYKVN